MERTVTRIVKGRKNFHAIDAESGKRFTAEPGDKVKVTPRQAQVFKDRLIDPDVAEAQAEAAKAEQEADKEAQDEPKEKSQPQQQAQPQGQAQGKAGTQGKQ